MLAVLLSLTMMSALAACGSSGNSGSSSNSESSDAKSSESSDGETMAKIKEEGKIVMGVNATYAPFEFHKTIDGEDQIVGFDIELGQAIADELGVELVVEDMSFDGLLPALATGKVDFLPGLAYSEERAQNASFSEPYHRSIQVVLMRDDNVDTVTEDSDLSGMTIGILKGSIQSTTFPTRYPNAKTSELGKIPDLVAALKSGSVDGVVLDYVVATLYAENNDDLAMSAIQYALTDEEDSGSCILVRKDNNEDLLVVINKVLTEVQANGDLERWENDAIALMDMDDIQ